MRDLTSRLPNGENFISWETTPSYHQELHVATNHPNASDDNDGHKDRPFKTINAAASKALQVQEFLSMKEPIGSVFAQPMAEPVQSRW